MIYINNISFSYGDHVIFDNASCSIPSNGVFLLRGDNGIGKSTLFKILIGELKLQSGNIKIQDIILEKSIKIEKIQILKNNISYISQENNFIDFLNAEDNASLDKILKNQKADDLTLLNNSYAKRTINQLSTGEKILISLQRALNENKKILLLDECSDFLDTKNTNLLIEKIDEISKNHLVIIISHDQRIIDYYNNVILIKNKKISLSFKANNNDKFEEFNKNKEKKSLFTLIQKFIKKQKLVSILMLLILSLFNSLIFSFTSAGTYSFKNAFENSINSGYYSFCLEYENIYIDGININTSVNFLSDPSLTREEIKKVEETFDIKYYGTSSYLIVSKYGKPNGKIKLSKKEYNNSKIIDDKVLIKFNSFNTSILMPYEIDYNIPFETLPLINIKDYNNLKFSDSITLSCGIWENEKMRFDTKNGLKEFFSTNSRIAYISPSLFEAKYDVKLPYEIDDNSIYISNQLLPFKVEQNVRFFNFDNYDLKMYENFFPDLNNVFSSKTKLYHDESFASLLEANEVIISENNFAKISKCISYLDNPFVYINDSNRKEYVNYLFDNNLEVYNLYESGEYSIHNLYNFKNKYYKDYWFYLIIFLLFLVVELSIIYIYAVSFKKKNKDNIRILKSYLSHNKNTFFFTLPFLIYQVLAYIISFIISFKILEILTNSLKYKIYPIQMNFASAFITLMINGLIYAFVYFIIKSQRKINE